MDKNNGKQSTLTSRVAAIEVKMLHLQFRMKKIYSDQEELNNKRLSFKTNREKIKGMINSAYSLIDMLITMEHTHQLTKDLFGTKELSQHFDKDMSNLIKNVRIISEKWKFVRNKLGGHIDIEMIEDMCNKHNFKGVFLSEDLESDLGILNMLLIENAVNMTRDRNDIFKRELDMKKNLVGEVELLVNRLMKIGILYLNILTP